MTLKPGRYWKRRPTGIIDTTANTVALCSLRPGNGFMTCHTKRAGIVLETGNLGKVYVLLDDPREEKDMHRNCRVIPWKKAA